MTVMGGSRTFDGLRWDIRWEYREVTGKELGGEHRPLSVTDIVTAMQACRANARELIEEAELLSEAGRQARAYTLSHTACEELAKFFIFEGAGKRLAQRNQPNWKRFRQRLRGHDSKLAQASVRLRYIMSLSPEDQDESVLSALQLLALGLGPRNSSMYVDVGPNGRFRKPSDIDWHIGLAALGNLASRLLRAADRLGSTDSTIELALHKPADKDEQSAIREMITSTVQDLLASGLSPEDIKAEASKLLKQGGRHDAN
jgi:AbiV family abortive infection protein